MQPFQCVKRTINITNFTTFNIPAAISKLYKKESSIIMDAYSKQLTPSNPSKNLSSFDTLRSLSNPSNLVNLMNFTTKDALENAIPISFWPMVAAYIM